MIIFADTSALVSLYSETDPNHDKAIAIVRSYKEVTFMISKYIFAEVVTILSQKDSKKQSITAGNILIGSYIWINTEKDIENLAWEIFKKQPSKNVSFVDCTTFALYKNGAFNKAFTFDSDFKTNKIPTLE